MHRISFLLGGPVLLALCLALPAAANTALPLSGLPELLAVGLVFPGILLGAVGLTLRPASRPSTTAGKGAAMAVASAGVVLLTWLIFALMAQEWRPESARDYWTGGFFLAPLFLAGSAWCAVFMSTFGNGSRWGLRRAWLGPPLCWLALELLFFVAGTLPAHLS